VKITSGIEGGSGEPGRAPAASEHTGLPVVSWIKLYTAQVGEVFQDEEKLYSFSYEVYAKVELVRFFVPRR
jgi:hypothetical protein